MDSLPQELPRPTQLSTTPRSEFLAGLKAELTLVIGVLAVGAGLPNSAAPARWACSRQSRRY